jgi:dihydrofolate reductase
MNMSRVVVSTFLTVDGVMEDPGGAEGFEHGGWQLPFFDDDLAGYMTEQQATTDGLLLGRITYQGFAAAWPSMTDEGGFADRMNSMPKYVASTTLTETTWNASLINGDVAEEVAKLKQQPGKNLLVLGSGQLAATLREHNLIDEYQLLVHPVVLGSGKRLFKEGSDVSALELVDTKTTSKGVLILTYRPAQPA